MSTLYWSMFLLQLPVYIYVLIKGLNFFSVRNQEDSNKIYIDTEKLYLTKSVHNQGRQNWQFQKKY